jgi:hypothetical protein
MKKMKMRVSPTSMHPANTVPALYVHSNQQQTMISSLLTIHNLYLSQAKNCVKIDIVATTAMSFARSTAIALFDANNIKLHTAGMMRYD